MWRVRGLHLVARRREKGAIPSARFIMGGIGQAPGALCAYFPG
ncbi:MAG TPA: hypothetical protein VMN57_03530 [Anaerolineales bacterium]|nr:hypothetical protein [Anaerolineales bacterium]